MTERVTDPFYQQCYRVFCWVGEEESEISSTQASFIIHETYRLAGRPSTSNHLAFNGEDVSFRELLGLLENLIPERKELEAAMQAVFDRYIGQVIRKGFVLYRRRTSGGCVPRTQKDAWKTTWITVQPGVVHLWKVKNGRLGSRKSISIEKGCRIETSADGELSVCSVISNDQILLQIAHFDPLESNILSADLQLAVTNVSKESLSSFDRKTAARYHDRDAEAEAERCGRLEKEKVRLERALDDERRALKDEEIVRGLATRMLEEERLKSEQMEQVLQELQLKLHGRHEAEEEEQNLIYDDEGCYQQDAYGDIPEIREYANEIESRQAEMAPEQQPDVWTKEDFLIISTQSI